MGKARAFTYLKKGWASAYLFIIHIGWFAVHSDLDMSFCNEQTLFFFY